jgi:hypothetical protein
VCDAFAVEPASPWRDPFFVFPDRSTLRKANANGFGACPFLSPTTALHIRRPGGVDEAAENALRARWLPGLIATAKSQRWEPGAVIKALFAETATSRSPHRRLGPDSDPISEAGGMDQAPHGQLRFRIPRLVSLHRTPHAGRRRP